MLTRFLVKINDIKYTLHELYNDCRKNLNIKTTSGSNVVKIEEVDEQFDKNLKS